MNCPYCNYKTKKILRYGSYEAERLYNHMNLKHKEKLEKDIKSEAK